MTAAAGIPLHVLIRPRAADFLYSEEEVSEVEGGRGVRCFKQCGAVAARVAAHPTALVLPSLLSLQLLLMEEDIRICREAGVDGVVLGALTAEGLLDTAAMRRLLLLAAGAGEGEGGGLLQKDACRARALERRPLAVTFHRAMDVSKEPLQLLQELLELESQLQQEIAEGRVQWHQQHRQQQKLAAEHERLSGSQAAAESKSGTLAEPEKSSKEESSAASLSSSSAASSVIPAASSAALAPPVLEACGCPVAVPLCAGSFDCPSASSEPRSELLPPPPAPLVHYILTSGGAHTALQGAAIIRGMVEEVEARWKCRQQAGKHCCRCCRGGEAKETGQLSSKSTAATAGGAAGGAAASAAAAVSLPDISGSVSNTAAKEQSADAIAPEAPSEERSCTCTWSCTCCFPSPQPLYPRIIAAGGVRPENAQEVLQESHAHQLHASARQYKRGGMTYVRRVPISGLAAAAAQLPLPVAPETSDSSSAAVGEPSEAYARRASAAAAAASAASCSASFSSALRQAAPAATATASAGSTAAASPSAVISMGGSRGGLPSGAAGAAALTAALTAAEDEEYGWKRTERETVHCILRSIGL